MFSSIGWGEIAVLIVAGLFILGPERLPDAARWLGRTSRQIKGHFAGMEETLRQEFGSEFDELRAPLRELSGRRTRRPRRAILDELTGIGDGPAVAKPSVERSADLRPGATTTPQ